MSLDSGNDESGAGLSLSSMVKEIQGLKDKFKREDADAPSPRALAARDTGRNLPSLFTGRPNFEKVRTHGIRRVVVSFSYDGVLNRDPPTREREREIFVRGCVLKKIRARRLVVLTVSVCGVE